MRFSALTTLYFAQGVPIGLLSVAIPAWLAEREASVATIAGFTGVVTLPWAFKLLAGPLMDRFGFPTMGFRRPWVLLAQGGWWRRFSLSPLLPRCCLWMAWTAGR